MSYKAKWAPKPPPEPVNTGSLSPEPKRRGRKRTKKQYFTPDTDLAIKEYLSSSNQKERDHIFATRIHYAFYKLAENLIHTFKFYYTEVDDLEDLKHEVIVFLLEKLDYFKPEKGSKAFSYFSIVGKNYLILYNNNNYKKKKRKVDVLEADEDDGVIRQLGRPERKQELKDFIDYFTEYIDKHIFTMFKKEKDRKVCDAINTLFKRRENLEIFNKKALYIYIREMTDVDTPIITKVTKILKRKYKELYIQYDSLGYVKI
jgi:DNA-directed RNA polymerase specialized sigma24 family protein